MGGTKVSRCQVGVLDSTGTSFFWWDLDPLAHYGFHCLSGDKSILKTRKKAGLRYLYMHIQIFHGLLVVQWLEHWVSDQGNFVFGGFESHLGNISENHSKSQKDLENNSQSFKSQKKHRTKDSKVREIPSTSEFLVRCHSSRIHIRSPHSLSSRHQ